MSGLRDFIEFMVPDAELRMILTAIVVIVVLATGVVAILRY
ncbi:MAG: hypothetical protein Q8R29_01875 [bacterium]|nr:hypothetical protein [bacterium]